MATKPRLDISMDVEVKRQVKATAAKKGLSMSQYCAQAIEGRLAKDGVRKATQPRTPEEAEELIRRMDELREKIGPIGVPTWQLVEEGRRR